MIPVIARALTFVLALSLVLVAAPLGPVSPTDTAEAAAPYCGFSADDPGQVVGAAECTIYVVQDCAESTVAGEPCTW